MPRKSKTASAGSDYVGLGGTLTFAAGTVRKTVSVTITTVEKDEQFALVLSRPVNVALARSSALCTITNDDKAPQPALSPPSSGSGLGGSA